MPAVSAPIRIAAGAAAAPAAAKGAAAALPFRVGSHFVRFSRPQTSLIHPPVEEHIIVPFAKITELRCVGKILFIYGAQDHHAFETDSEAKTMGAFEALAEAVSRHQLR
jgi:hypothetical protein